MSRPLRRHALSAALSLACTTAVFAAAAHEPSDLPTVEVTASPLAGDADSLARPVEVLQGDAEQPGLQKRLEAFLQVATQSLLHNTTGAVGGSAVGNGQ